MAAPEGYGGYGGGGYYPPRIPPNIAEESTTGTRAAGALWLGLACYGVSIVANVIYFRGFWDVFDKAMSTTGTTRGRSTTPTIQVSGTAAAAQGVGLLASLGIWIAGILFIIWFHRALTNAQAIGIPQRRSPGWGIAGFFIPIGNFFLPYQSAVDLFPPEHPDRKLVGRWWAFWLTAQLSTSAAFIAAFVSLPLATAMGVVIFGLYTMAAISARDMIGRSLALHTEWAGAAGWPAGPVLGYGNAAMPGTGPSSGAPFQSDPANQPGPPGPPGPPGAWKPASSPNPTDPPTAPRDPWAPN